MGYKKSYEAARQELRAAIGLLKKQKEENKNSESMYAVTGVITDDNKVLIAGNYYQYALVVDIDLYAGKTVVCVFDKTKSIAFIVGD